MKVSIIVRAKNEERWITSSLNAIFNQSFKDIEVILVDNQSTDMTVAKAKKFNVKVLQIEDYLPGKALNLGIEASSGEFIASISAHCIPKDQYWLSNLLRNFEDESVAGVYGRQEPMSFTNDLDKRDLHITFGLDRRVQVKDCFFHNANSLIKRSIWEKIPFDGTITNIEDRVWGQRVIDTGYKIIYEPEAAVFHHHGIHQSMDIERCKNIVRIMESLNENNGSKDVNIDSFLDNLKIVGIVAVGSLTESVSETPGYLFASGSERVTYAVSPAIQSPAPASIVRLASLYVTIMSTLFPPYVKTTLLSPPTSSTVTSCEVPFPDHDSNTPLLMSFSVINTSRNPSTTLSAVAVELFNLQLSVHPISPCSASDMKVFPPFVSVSLLAKVKLAPEPDGSAKLNLHLSAVVGSMFSAGSVIDNDKCVSSEGLLLARLIAVSPLVFPNSTSMLSPPYSTSNAEENSNDKM